MAPTPVFREARMQPRIQPQSRRFQRTAQQAPRVLLNPERVRLWAGREQRVTPAERD